MSPFDMPPWDQLTRFGTIKETFFSSLSAHQQVCQNNPRRAILIFTLSGGGTAITLTTSSTTTSGQGLVVNSTNAIILLTCNNHGPLTTLAWYSPSSSTSALTVFEWECNIWDSDQPLPLPIAQLVQPQSQPQQVTKAPGVGGLLGVLDYWRRKIGG